MPYEDQVKIVNKVKELNNGSDTGDWLPVVGFNAFVGFNFSPAGGANFTRDTGYPIKLFVNQRTGEIKMYPMVLFISHTKTTV